MLDTLKQGSLAARLKQQFGPRPVPIFFHHLYNLALMGKGLLRRARLRGRPESLSCNPFFVIGSGRSGNTLLRAILTAHPALAIPPESYVLGRAIRHYRFYSFLPWELLARLVITEFESFEQFPTWEIEVQPFYATALTLPAEKRHLAGLLDAFYSYYAQARFPGATRWGDKTPANTFQVKLIDQVFPQAQYLHMVRDGRDAVASYLTAGLYHDPEEACRRWLRSVEIAQQFGARLEPGRYLEVTYEDLVRTPQATTQAVCHFLGVDFRPEMLEFWRTTDTLGDTKLAHHSNLRNPINEKSIGKWRRDLPPETRQYIETRLEAKLRALNYPIGEGA